MRKAHIAFKNDTWCLMLGDQVLSTYKTEALAELALEFFNFDP